MSLPAWPDPSHRGARRLRTSARRSDDASTRLEEFIYEEDHADSYMWELVKETTSDGDAWKLKCVVGGHWLNIAYHSDQPGAEAKVWNDPSDTHAYRLWTPERVPSTASGVELPMTFSDPQEFQCLDLLPLRGGEHQPASRTARAGQLHVFMPIPGRLAMADFSLSTEKVAEWDHYVEILAGVCNSIAST
ncbi:hypothetical protein MOV08_02305 [Streptomyces yunnanensis]|uniref:Uncharacterized protein n=1 Tax=Streptomyces yunnanensis TaxID=156453 RepID=A0ABY8A3X0_9ACTN|nr:hypothetical protein [Streptomyces yunnanensis]WEB38247.1 hypothetical protein MOV08_02305 [Streptomyces yunnanensis]